jgi:hypothetical protein
VSRQYLLFFTASMCLATCSLWGQIEQVQREPTGIFSVEAEYEQFSHAKIYMPETHKNTHLSLSTTNTLATYEWQTSEQTACHFGVGYQGMHFDFSKKPPFSQKHFANALFDIGGYTKEVEGWKWKADLLAQINAENFALSRYTFFTGLLKGKYAWHKKRNLHVGILAYAGMRYSRALPVLGFDYIPNDTWKLSIVYPLHMFLQYKLNQNWSVETGIRYFLARQRMNEGDTLRRGYVAVRTWGAEIGLNYVINDWMKINAHIGEVLENRMRVSDRHDKNRKHFRLRDAAGFGFVASIAL